MTERRLLYCLLLLGSKAERDPQIVDMLNAIAAERRER